MRHRHVGTFADFTSCRSLNSHRAQKKKMVIDPSHRRLERRARSTQITYDYGGRVAAAPEQGTGSVTAHVPTHSLISLTHTRSGPPRSPMRIERYEPIEYIMLLYPLHFIRDYHAKAFRTTLGCIVPGLAHTHWPKSTNTKIQFGPTEIKL